MRQGTRFTFTALLSATLTIALLLTGCAGTGGGSGKLTILHTNDLHAHFLPEEGSRRDDGAPVGGFIALESTITAEREKAEQSLYLDAGDFMTGTPLSNMEHRGAKGGALVEFYNLVDLDGMTIGNHEFDHSLEEMDALFGLADFPVFGANLADEEGRPFTGHEYKIYKTGGVRVGVIGITTEELGGLVSREKREVLTITTGVETVERLLPEVDEKSDLIVLLSHEGVWIDREIARRTEGIDMIVGGHSHTRLNEGEWVNGVLIVQAGSSGRYLGRADLVVEDDAIAEAECRLVPVVADSTAIGSPKMAALVDRFEKMIDEKYDVVIAEAKSDLGRCYYCESDLGNWLADRLREITGTDVAVINSGGIRKGIDAGPVKKLDIQEVLPFTNMICRFECTGEELLAIALHNAEAEATEDHGILQVSGITYSWYRKADGIGLHKAYVDGEEIDPARRYTVGTVDFVGISQPEKYLGIVPESVESLGATVTSRVMEAVEKIGVIEAPQEDRVQRVEIDYR